MGDYILSVDLKHGAIYELDTVAEARCNISKGGDEVWFTIKSGKETGGNPIRFLRDMDRTFINNDV